MQVFVSMDTMIGKDFEHGLGLGGVRKRVKQLDELEMTALQSLQTGMHSSLAYGTKARSEHALAIGR